jgi:phosphate transport system protein
MERHFDIELKALKKNLILMATMAQEAIIQSVASVEKRDRAIAQKVINDDNKIDEIELMIDERCIDLIALHQPMAGDLRFVTITMKINAELERIADLAVDVAQRTLEIADQPLLKPLIDIPKLSVVAQTMVRDALDAFVDGDVEKAKRVVRMDDQADQLRDHVHNELVNAYMTKDPSTVSRAVALLLVSRYLERICDHATNIAEDVVYMVNGRVVKHRHNDLN